MRCDGKSKPNKYVRVTGRLRFGLRDMLEQAVLVEEQGRELQFLCDNRDEVWRVMTLLVKEEGTIEWLRRSVTPETVFFDIGANIGLYSIYGASLMKNGRVFAFEPHAINFVHLIKNINANRFNDLIMPLSIALFDEAGLLPFSYFDWAAGSSKNQIVKNDNINGGVFRELKYAAILDDLIEANALPAPDLIKIDVDGVEPQIIKGMKRLMQSNRRPRSIQVEIQKNDSGGTAELMESQGYVLDHRHFTMAGKNKLKRGLTLDKIAHNAVFTPA